MTKEEAIQYLQQFYPNGGHCWLDEQRIEAIGMAVKALQEFDDAIEHGKKIVLAELERIIKEKEEAGKNYVFVFSEVKELVEKMSQKE